MTINLPTNLLRTFIAIVDAGSMMNATSRVFLTQSALSLQIKRLEELVQQNLFVRDGRRLVLTPAGDVLLDYARRILPLHDEAVAAVKGRDFSGPVRIGMVQDFADTLLSGLLARFGQAHPDTQIYARIGRTADLLTALGANDIDIVLGFADADLPSAIRVTPMSWHGAQDLANRDVMPLAVLEGPCRFRDAAIAALEAAGRPYRLVVETPNLSTIRAAVSAGLALTSRTPLFVHDNDRLTDETLPQLPDVACMISTGPHIDAAGTRLAELANDVILAL